MLSIVAFLAYWQSEIYYFVAYNLCAIDLEWLMFSGCRMGLVKNDYSNISFQLSLIYISYHYIQFSKVL